MSAAALPRRRPADNPFAVERTESLACRLRTATWPHLVGRLDLLGGRAAVVGPHGSGKSTLLAELACRLDGEVVAARIPGSCRRPWTVVRTQLPRRVDATHSILLDGGEQLGTLAWSRLRVVTAPARRLVMTVHAPGRLPTLVTLRPDVLLLRDLVRELAPADAAALDPLLPGIFRRHRGNIRECLRELYDLFAGRMRVASFEF
jgi:hypothetical protein